MATKTVTLGEVVDAIKLNGLPKHKGWQKSNDKGEVVAACAIAQAAINLGVSYSSLSAQLGSIFVFDGTSEPESLSSWIMHTNDATSASVSDIGHGAARRVQALRLMPLVVTQDKYRIAKEAIHKGV